MICNNLKGLFRRVGVRGRIRPVLPRFSFTMNLEGVLFGGFNKIPRFNLIKTVINSTKKVYNELSFKRHREILRMSYQIINRLHHHHHRPK